MKIVVSERIGSMICANCGLGIGDEQASLLTHAKRHGVPVNIAREIFQSVQPLIGIQNSGSLRDLYLAKTWSKNPLYLPFVPELPVETLFSCPTCSFCSETVNGLQAHARRYHNLVIQSGKSLNVVHGQAFWKKKIGESFGFWNQKCKRKRQEKDLRCIIKWLKA